MMKRIIIFLAILTCVAVLFYGLKDEFSGIKSADREMVEQFRADAERALNEGYDVILCRPGKRSIFSHSGNDLQLAMVAEFEVIMSIKDEFICGSSISVFSRSDMPYRESVNYNVSPFDNSTIQAFFARRSEMITTREFAVHAFAGDKDFYHECHSSEMLPPLTPAVAHDSLSAKNLLTEFDNLRVEYRSQEK